MRLVRGTGAGGATQVKVFRGDGAMVRSFTASQFSTNASVRVAVVDFDQDGRNDLLTSFDNKVQVRDGQTYAIKSTVAPFDTGYRSQMFIG